MLIYECLSVKYTKTNQNQALNSLAHAFIVFKNVQNINHTHIESYILPTPTLIQIN